MTFSIVMKINVFKSGYTVHLEVLSPECRELFHAGAHYAEAESDRSPVCGWDDSTRGIPVSAYCCVPSGLCQLAESACSQQRLSLPAFM